MKNMGEFIELTRVIEKHAEILIDDWKTENPEYFKSLCDQPVTIENILELRNWVSGLFAERLAHICTEALYDRFQKAHVEFIAKFDEKASEKGFLITQKRKCVTFTELMRDAGLIQVTTKGVSLTPKGIAVAEEVQREIDGTD